MVLFGAQWMFWCSTAGKIVSRTRFILLALIVCTGSKEYRFLSKMCERQKEASQLCRWQRRWEV